MEGTCPFRDAYGCTEEARTHSRNDLGFCCIEKALFESSVAKGLWLLDKREMEEATDEERRQILLFAEAAVYRFRASTALALQSGGRTEVLDPSSAWRYLTAGINATNARQEALLRGMLLEV